MILKVVNSVDKRVQAIGSNVSKVGFSCENSPIKAQKILKNGIRKCSEGAFDSVLNLCSSECFIHLQRCIQSIQKY